MGGGLTGAGWGERSPDRRLQRNRWSWLGIVTPATMRGTTGLLFLIGRPAPSSSITPRKAPVAVAVAVGMWATRERRPRPYVRCARWPVLLCELVQGLLGRAEPTSAQRDERFNGNREAFIAFDSAKLKNAVAMTEGGRDGEVRIWGRSPTRRKRSASWSRSSRASCVSVSAFLVRPTMSSTWWRRRGRWTS